MRRGVAHPNRFRSWEPQMGKVLLRDCRPRSLGWIGVFWIALCTVVGSAEALGGEAAPAVGDSSSKAPPSELRFIRVYAPADRIAQWPWGDTKYVPVEAAEFERLIRQMDWPESVRPPQAGIVSGQYTARFSEPQFLEGEATFQVQNQAPEGAVVRWERWHLPVRNAAWLDAEGKPKEPAVFGLGEAGLTELLVPRSGSLHLNWSFQGEREASGTVRFDLRLPPCPHTQLVVDLPETLRPVLPQSLIQVQEPAPGAGRKSWLLQWGGETPGPLRFVPESGLSSRPILLVHQEVQYLFSQYALEVAAQFRVQAPEESVSEVSFLVDAGLEVVRVKLADQEVPWTVHPFGKTGTRRLVVSLPQPIHGEVQILQVEAAGPVRLETPWQTPRIRLEGGTWQQGTLGLRMISPLVLQRLTRIGCRQSKSEPLAASGASPGGEYFEFQSYTPEASVEIILGRVLPQLQADTGCLVMLSDRQMSCRVRTRLRAEGGEHFQVEAQVGRRWLIDAVEADASTQVEDWSLEPNSQGLQRLRIRLTRPVTPTRPVSLLITGRRLQSPLGRTWRSEDLVPVRLGTNGAGKRLVALCPTDASYELICLTPEASPQLNPRQLDPADWELVEKTAEGFLFWDTPQSELLQWVLQTRLPRYRAKIRLDVLASQKSLLEQYRIECVPDGARVERVVILFSQSRPEAVRWSLGGDLDRQWTARRLTEKDLPFNGMPPGGEAWEIVLRPSRSGAFEILGERTTAIGPETPVALVGVPQAAEQEAVVRVRSVGPQSPQIVSQRIQPLPSGSEDFAPGWTAQLAAFRYAPDQELAGQMPPALLLRPQEDALSAQQTWAWHCRLDSRFQADGLGEHTATYWLANFQRTQLTVQLPPGVDCQEIEKVWLNGQQARWTLLNPSQDGSGPSILVDLSPVRTFSILVIGFRIQGNPLRHMHRIRPPFPQLDVPVATRSWTVWLHPGLDAVCPSQYCVSGNSPEISLRERLFGVWARPQHRQPFDPFDSSHWKALFASDPQTQHCRQQAEAFFQTLGMLLAASPEKREPGPSTPKPAGTVSQWTWSDLLQQEAFGRLGVHILIDRQGVWEAGIDPDTPVRMSAFSAKGAEERVGREALWQAGLALIVQPGMILMTSAERAASCTSQAQNLGDPLAWYVPRGGLVRQVQQAAASKTDSAFVWPEVWQECADPSAPSVLRPLDLDPSRSLLGWSAYQMEVSESAVSTEELAIEILDRDRQQAWYWAAFLAAGGISLLLAGRRPGGAMVVVGLLGAVALMVPDSLVSVGAGAFSGMFVGLGWWAFRGKRPTPSEEVLLSGAESSQRSSSAGVLVVPGILLVLGLLWSGDAPGAEAPLVQTAVPGSGLLYRVFIPIDEKEQPTGDPYQVPEPFYQYLRRHGQRSVPTLSRWRTGQALYRGELTRNPTTGRWELPRLTATWQCELLGKLSQVSLSVSREKFLLIPGSWTVDGQPVEPRWNEDGTLLILPVSASAPTIRVDGQVRPVGFAQGGMEGVDVPIPPTPEARLEVLLPAEAPEIHVPTALGMVKRLAEPSARLAAELGPTERISLRWPLVSQPSGEATPPDVEQLLWLRIQPGAVVLEARFRVQLPESSSGVGRLRVAADPRLRLLPSEPGGSQSEVVVSTSSGTPVFEFPLAASGQDRAIVSARFLAADTTGLGSVRLPKLEPLEVRVSKRWLAVSVDSSLEYPEPSPNRDQVVPVPEFLNLWGPAESPPQFVDHLPPAPSQWSLVTRPRTPNSSVEQTLSLGYGEKTVRVQYEARLTTTSGYSFQHRLQVPQDLQIEKIAILEGNEARAVRWACTPDGKLSIFSHTPLSGRYELRLSGSLPNVLSQRRPIPYVEIEGAETEWAILELFRQPEVLVRVVKSEGLTEMELAPPSETKSSLGRPLKCFAVDPRQMAETEIQVLPNQPQCKAQQITLLRPGTDRWEAEVDLQVHVQSGLVDALLLEVPSIWPGPYQTTPPVSLSIKELSEGRRGVVLRPSAPIEQNFRLRISGPIHWPKTGPQEAPKILLQNFPNCEHFLLLPSQFQLHTIVWETQGLEKTEIPEGSAPLFIGEEAWVAYRVSTPRFTARLRTLVDEQERPEVRLADVHLRWEADGACSGKAWFYLLPGGQDRCVVSLPSDFRLLQIQVEDNPAPPVVAQDSQHVTVLLASSVLPQVLEVSFVGTLPPGAIEGSAPFPAPRVENWPLAASLWTIYPPLSYALAEREGVGRVSPLRLSVYRLRTIGGLVETGCRQMSGSKEDFLRWYRVWEGRFWAILRQVQRQLALPPPTESHHTVRAEAQSLQLKLNQWAEALGIPENSTAPPEPTSADSASVWLGWLDRPDRCCRVVVHGPSEGVVLTYLPKTSWVFNPRWLLAAGLAVAFLALAWAIQKASVRTGLARWAHLLGVLLGCFWWLWLWPSVVGLCVILLSVGTVFHKGFRSARAIRRL